MSIYDDVGTDYIGDTKRRDRRETERERSKREYEIDLKREKDRRDRSVFLSYFWCFLTKLIYLSNSF